MSIYKYASRGRLLCAAIVLCLLGGCYTVPISRVPNAGERQATVTVVRENRHLGSLIPFFLLIDGVAIARLDNGEYTAFPVSEGTHMVAIQWKLPPVPVPYGPYLRSTQIEARAGGTYLIMVTAQEAPPKDPPSAIPDYSKGVAIWLVDDEQKRELMLRGKKFIAPGHETPM